MITRKAISAALLALCAVPVFTAAKPVVAAPPKGGKAGAKAAGTKIDRPELNFTFTLPASYHEIPAAQRPAQLVFLATGPVFGNFKSNVNIVVEPCPVPGIKDLAEVPEEDIAKFGQVIIAGMKKTIPSYQLQNYARAQINGKTLYFMAGSYDVPGTEIAVRNRQAMAVQDGKLYTMTFSANLDSFDKAVPAFEKMLNSIDWK